jgi:hypothetical protein
MPDDPIVRMSGFVVDPALDSLAFTERDRIKPWRGTSGGYARITRYYENGGDRQYLFLIPPRPHGVDSRQWAGQLAEMRDTPIIMDHRYDRIDLLYPVPAKDEEAIVWLDDHRHTDEIHFTFDHHAGCQIVITTDTLSPLSPRARATVAIEGGVRIYDVQTERYQAFIPDSVSLTFNHVPGGGGPLTGRFHARKTEFGRMGSDENDRLWDVVMEGAFRITLPDNYENP